MRTKPPRKLGGYFIVIGLALGIGLIGTFVLGRSYSELALQKEAFDRLQYVPSFDPIEDATLGPFAQLFQRRRGRAGPEDPRPSHLSDADHRGRRRQGDQVHRHSRARHAAGAGVQGERPGVARRRQVTR